MTERGHTTSIESVTEDLWHEDEIVRDALLINAADESAPEYIDTVCRIIDSPLTISDVKALPETAAEIWQDQYGILPDLGSDSNIDQLELLAACKLLYDLGLGHYPSKLTYGVYQHVLGNSSRDRGSFRRAAKALEECQWLNIHGESAYGPDVEYRLHDTQVEAARFSLTITSSFPNSSSTISAGMSPGRSTSPTDCAASSRALCFRGVISLR